MRSALINTRRAVALRLQISTNAGVTSQARWNSSQSPGTQQTGQKQVSPHIGFYKTFTRPVAKVLLMATFVYQLSNWTWVKLEKEEIKRDKTAKLTELEKQLEGMTKKPNA